MKKKTATTVNQCSNCHWTKQERDSSRSPFVWPPLCPIQTSSHMPSRCRWETFGKPNLGSLGLEWSEMNILIILIVDTSSEYNELCLFNKEKRDWRHHCGSMSRRIMVTGQTNMHNRGPAMEFKQKKRRVKYCQILIGIFHPQLIWTILKPMFMIFLDMFHVLCIWPPSPPVVPPSRCMAFRRHWDPAEMAATGPRSPSSRCTSCRADLC
jgi:hypothetical protein